MIRQQSEGYLRKLIFHNFMVNDKNFIKIELQQRQELMPIELPLIRSREFLRRRNHETANYGRNCATDVAIS